MLEILALDDWTSVIAAATPYVQKYGGDVVDWLIKRWKGSGKVEVKPSLNLQNEEN